MKVTVFDIEHFSLHDGPGIRTVVFLKGCPLHCLWCHNPEGLCAKPQLFFCESNCVNCGACFKVCPNGCHVRTKGGKHHIYRENCTLCGKCQESCFYSALRITGKEMDCESVLADVARELPFYETSDGGVTFSGGEPFAQPQALLNLLKRCKEEGISTAVETSGVMGQEALVKSLEWVDTLLFDFKESDPELFFRFCGGNLRLVLNRLDTAAQFGIPITLRCPIIPNCNDREEHYFAIAALAERYAAIKQVEIMGYHPLGIEKYASVGLTAGYYNATYGDETAQQAVTVISSKTTKPVMIG